jgi:hypothetical protein
LNNCNCNCNCTQQGYTYDQADARMLCLKGS